MDENIHLIESLLGQATQYGKTSIELIKLKAVDKTSDGISSVVPFMLVVCVLGWFLFFINVGAACWLGEVLGKIYFGFFVVAGFYAVVAFILRLFMYKWIKRVFYDYIIKQLLKNS